jgi:hypothetical protein
MKIEINGRVVEVDDNFAQMSSDQQQEIVNNIASQLGGQPGIAQKIAETLGLDAENKFFWSGAGALSGPLTGKAISAGYRAATSAPDAGSVSTTSGGPGSPGQKWSSGTGYGAGPGYTVREVSEEFQKQRAPVGSGKVTKGVTKDKPLTIQEYNEQKAKQAAEAERLRKLRPVTEKIAEKVPSSVKTAGRAIEGAASAIPPWLARGAAGASLGYQAADAYNRLMAGDIRGGILGGLGAIGSGMAFIPHPLTRGIGTAMAVGAPMLNEMLDKPEDTTQGVNNPMAAGGLAYLAGGRKAAAKEAFEYGSQKLGKLSDWAQNYINQYVVPTQSDRMRYVGGPSFSANQLGNPEYQGKVWGSGKPSTASAIANQAMDPRYGGPLNQIFVPQLGSKQMHQSNQIVFDRMLEDFYKNPEKLTPELRKAINEYIQSGGLVSGKSKASFDPIEGFDIADKERVKELAKTFDVRKAIAEHAFGGTGIGKRKAQIIPYEKIMQETTDPLVLEAPTFSVGPRAFRLSGETEKAARPDLNPAFPYMLRGEDLGVTYAPVPGEAAFLDFGRQWRKETGRTLPKKSGDLQNPGYYEYTMGYTPAGSSERVFPRQQIKEDWIKELQRQGFYEGGLA